jgi:ParB-like chromosome segregation protein Spo0J
VTTQPLEVEEEVLSPEELQYAALEAKLREWNLTYHAEREFPITDVNRLSEVQVREGSHIAPAQRVEEYAQQMRNGALFPPILLRTPNILIDGNTRLAAAKRIGRQTFPAVIVDTKTAEMAKILAASVNQMGGERLTATEAHEAALLMMRQGYPDAAVARELGRDLSQVRRWRNQRDVEERAERLGLADQLPVIPRNTLGTLSGISREEPFAELVKLFADVRPAEKQAREIVQQAVQAPSDEAAVAKVAEIREELAPVGPPPRAAARRELPLVRAAIGNLLKIRGRVDVAFDPAKRDEELKRWQELRQVIDEVLKALQGQP